MSCERCHNETESDEPVCQQCRNEEIKVLSPEEQSRFHGLTIEHDPVTNREEHSQFHDRQNIQGNRIHMYTINNGLAAKLLIGAAFAILTFLVFSSFALFAIGGGLFFLFSRLFKK